MGKALFICSPLKCHFAAGSFRQARRAVFGRCVWTLRIYSSNELCERPWIMSLTLPNDEYSPPELPERTGFSFVAFDVSCKLLPPELHVCGWHSREPAAFVAVPEASMHENRDGVPRKHNVWFPGQILAVKTKTKSSCVESSPDC